MFFCKIVSNEGCLPLFTLFQTRDELDYWIYLLQLINALFLKAKMMAIKNDCLQSAVHF